MVNINGMFNDAYERKNNCRPGMGQRIKWQLFYFLVHTYIDQIQVLPIYSFHNTCEAANHHYFKVLTPYVEMELQQPHIYFDVQIYTTTHRYGY